MLGTEGRDWAAVTPDKETGVVVNHTAVASLTRENKEWFLLGVRMLRLTKLPAGTQGNGESGKR